MNGFCATTLLLCGAAFPAHPAHSLGEGADLEIGGQGDGNGKFFHLTDLTFDDHNNLYVLDGGEVRKGVKSGNFLVQKFDNDGKFLSQFSVWDDKLGDGNLPTRIAVDSKGDIYVTQPIANEVQEFSPDGTAAAPIPIKSAFAITDWVVGGKDLIAVIGNHQWGIDGHGGVWGGDQIYVIGQDGKTADPIPLDHKLTNVQDVTSDTAGNLYMQADVNQVYKFDASGKLLFSIGAATRTRAEDGSELLHSVAVDSKGNIFSWTFGNPAQLAEFDPELKQVKEREGQFHWADAWSPASSYTPLAIDHNDRIWVGVTAIRDPKGPNFSRYHFSPAVVRPVADFLAPSQHGVRVKSTLLLGLKSEVVTSLPYGIAYDLRPFPLDFVVKPANRLVRGVHVESQVDDMYKTEAGHGAFDLNLLDAVEGRQAFTFTPPGYGWYTVSCTLSHGGETLQTIGAHFGVTPHYPGMPDLAAGESKGGWEDAPRQAFVGLPLMRLHPAKGLDQLDADITSADKYGVSYFCQFSDKKDCTPENVSAVVTRFKGRVKVWEIMNEPNFSMKPEDYVAMLKTLYPIIKAIDPQAQVMGPDVCGIQLPWYEAFYKLGGKDVTDILSIHDYEGHESIDPNHWEWKIGALRALMAQYGDGNKPLWQTERAITGVRGDNFLGPCQAVRTTLHRDLLERLGIPPEHNSLYYLNEGGYSSVPSYLWSSSGPHPAALALRTRYAMTLGRKYTGNLDFGTTGNKLFWGLRYEGADGTTIVLRNLGTADWQVEFGVQGGASLQVIDAFGNARTVPVNQGSAALTLSQMPSYARLAPGQQLMAPRIDFGPNLAGDATFTYSGKNNGNLASLNNGIMESFHAGNPHGGTGKPVFFAGDLDGTPQNLDIVFPTPRTISKMLVFGVRADNTFCALLDYDLQYADGDQWITIDKVRTAVPETNPAETAQCIADTWYLDNNFFVHNFKPVTTSKLRIVALRSTHGFVPDDRSRAWGNLMPEQLMLREIEIYGPAPVH